MDEQELGALIEKLSETVERLAHERPGSGEYNHESGVLKDARLLLADRRKKKEVRTDVKF
jgi:Arc/MetJ-type ribon-helix-helix transcriptional regulator